ncbi:MAG: PAS domain-containing protein [Syntrophales bacterium]|nr:PAS domain-containing protein [Syntrophales bacterium]
MIGSVSKEILEAMLETIPIEFSVVDAKDEVLAWNKHETRIFKRPEAIVGLDVRNLHPEKSKSLEKVKTILAEMKVGTCDKANFWIDLPIGEGRRKEKVLIQYFALRDKDGQYLGCMACSQNIAEIQALSGEHRLID